MANQKAKRDLALTPEARARLEALAPDIPTVRERLATLKKLGMDVKPLEEKLDWAEETRKILLKEFT